MVEALPNVLYHLESFDPALVRSAIPNYFLAKLASEHVKVILTGEGADEVYAGYDYLARYETPDGLQDEMLHITNALHNTNLQRADRMSMAFGLEARVPFLDVRSVAFAMGLPADWKLHNGRTPKALLRQSFADDLPREIVNRPKAKFSKGAGSSELIAQEAVEKITDQEFIYERERLKKDWDYRLQNKEALYYYRILREFYDDEWILPTMGNSRMTTTHYDTIIIGAGHNGLVAAAYLARQGKKVLVLERRAIVGGSVVTESFGDGFYRRFGLYRRQPPPRYCERPEIAASRN
jgi:asparagine synthase (glutamine-hydrolysing)